ncbi:PREDICTED: uncharacterized protein LOC106748327 [Dinoponera quadriceps]|uniref:Uncharacterized protein LOC106748327 n=1 Tax=Dinoponera quadriceps TaxID=609295 RepID=A0A6P3XVV4_DINQU|nr:PREDICTED: uncharacterized protein LOC106748327 [Dinoponera quadriceps]
MSVVAKVILNIIFGLASIFAITNAATYQNLNLCQLTSERLPIAKVQPIKYDIRLHIKPLTNISGITDITIDVKEQTKNISLHARNLRVNQKCTIIMKPDTTPKCVDEYAAFKLNDAVYCADNEILLLIFSDVIPSGQHVLHIEYTSLFNETFGEISYPYSWSGQKKW